jgi:hypothetical protein
VISAKATETFSVYWNYQVWDLAEGQQVDGGLAEYLLTTGSPVEEVSDTPAVDSDGDGVPDGTAAQVLGWVDNDPAKATLALAAEQRREPPRSTLATALEKLVRAPEPDQPAAPEPTA